MSGSDTDEQNFGNIRAGLTKIGGTDVALTTLGNISETQDAATFWKCRTDQQHFGGIREGQGTTVGGDAALTKIGNIWDTQDAAAF